MTSGWVASSEGLTATEQASVETPEAGKRRLVAKSGGWYDVNDAGTETLLGSGGGGSGTELTEVPFGTVDGANTVFTVAHDYVPTSTRVWLNGLRNFASINYTEDGTNQVTLGFAPVFGDLLIVEYIEL